MTEAILFPDTEALAVTILSQRLAERTEDYTADVYVDTVEPQTRRGRQVIIRRDGGPRLDLVREVSRLTVRVWARTPRETNDLARMVAAFLGMRPDGSTPLVLSTVTGGPYAVPDADYRLLTAEWITVGTALI